MSNVTVIAHHMVTPLGHGSEWNYRQILAGRTAVRRHRAVDFGLKDDFMAAIIEEPIAAPRAQSLALLCLSEMVETLPDALPADDTLLVLSTTKGNVLTGEECTASIDGLPEMAETLRKALGLTMPALVVSTACTSGLSAIIAAKRALESGRCRRAIVCGVEVQGRFIVSGFQSLYALSDEPCQPFSANRHGLNVGEAAACMLLALNEGDAGWTLADSSSRNDAFHISQPSRTAEGSTAVLQNVLKGCGMMEDAACPSSDHLARTNAIGFVSLHGTATLYNDEMEAKALSRAGLSDVPAISLKGYFGHTMGAAGVLETIISMLASEHGVLPATMGYDDELGTSKPLGISSQAQTCPKRSPFVKLISGFGGCNAALLMRYCGETSATVNLPSGTTSPARKAPVQGSVTAVSTSGVAVVHDVRLASDAHDVDTLTALYRSLLLDYPKFHKMDALSQLGFLASEMLLERCGEERFVPRHDRAIVLASSKGCWSTDCRYADTLRQPDGFFPSPSLFVYTLPNIVAGEIAIRNSLHGEASMYLLPRYDEAALRQLAIEAMSDGETRSVILGWLDYQDDEHYEAIFQLIEHL